MSTSVQSVETLKIRAGNEIVENDLVVTEEPLEIRVGYGDEADRAQFTLSVTMRTPGNDEELCLGFLYAEGVIQGKTDVMSVKYCGDQDNPEEKDNVMRV